MSARHLVAAQLLVLCNVGEKLGDSVQVLILPVHVQVDVLPRLLDCTLTAFKTQTVEDIQN